MNLLCRPIEALRRWSTVPILRTVCLLGLIGLAGCAGSSSNQSASSSHASLAPLVHLPADQASHRTAANEWWYVVGHLRSGGRTFGYEVTIFKFHQIHLPNAPSGAPAVSLFRTDVAITDEASRQFYHKVTYYFPNSASASSTTLDARAGSTALSGSSPRSMYLTASLPAGQINLHLASRRPAMDVGGRGYIPFGNGYTYYYSLTDLATHGSLRIRGKTFRATGVSWLDHQWGNWSWGAVQGWTWMALQLSNGVQLSVFDFRSTSRRVRAASVLLSDGRLRTVSGVKITSLGSWRSPHTGGLYPSGWLVRIPALRAQMRVSPSVRDQEMTSRIDPRASYWEGSGRLRGTFQGKTITGLSYTELTGYAGAAPAA